jgi:hypothetical protein
VLKVDDGVVRDLGVERVHKIMIAGVWETRT